MRDAKLVKNVGGPRFDPDYAPPYASLAVTYLAASQTSVVPPKVSFPKAKAAALKAVQLDGNLGEAHGAHGEIYLWHDCNWFEAEREITRALELNPDSPEALRSPEVYLTLIAARPDEAMRTSQRILDLDPLNPFSRVQTIWTAFQSPARRVDRAGEEPARDLVLLKSDIHCDRHPERLARAASPATCQDRQGAIAPAARMWSQSRQRTVDRVALWSSGCLLT